MYLNGNTIRTGHIYRWLAAGRSFKARDKGTRSVLSKKASWLAIVESAFDSYLDNKTENGQLRLDSLDFLVAVQEFTIHLNYFYQRENS